jgi:hypothetical protein
VAGVHREYSRGQHYINHLDRFLGGL